MRSYGVQTLVSELVVRAGAADKRLLGFGPAGRIYHFEHIIDDLLATDLADLTEARKAASLFTLFPSALMASLVRFLESPAHVRVAKATEAGGEWWRRASQELNAAISEDHARNVGNELRVALNRTARRVLLLVTLPLALLVPVAAVVATAIAMPRVGSDYVFLAGFVGVVVACVVAGEMLGRAILRRKFGTSWSLVLELLRSYRVLRRVRVISTVCGVLVPAWGVALALSLPFTQPRLAVPQPSPAVAPVAAVTATAPAGHQSSAKPAPHGAKKHK